MFINLLTVSTVCVFLAFNGWVPDDSDTPIEPVQGINNQSITRDAQYASTNLQSLDGDKNRSITEPEYHCPVKGVTEPQKSFTTHVNSLPTAQDVFTYVSNLSVTPQTNLTFPILALGDRPGYQSIHSRITNPRLTELDTKDGDPVTDRGGCGHRHPIVAIYQITDIPYEGRKHSWMLVMLKLTVPVWMVVIIVKEKREQLKQLKILEVIRLQKKIFNKNDNESKHSHGKGDLSRKKGSKEKTVAKVELPGRQQKRRGRRRRQQADVKQCGLINEGKRLTR